MDRSILTNAGRCDICGQPIDMKDSGDKLTLAEYGIEDEEIKDEHDLTDRDAIEAVADAMERVADSGAGYDLAKTIRGQGEIKVHNECLYETNYGKLEVPYDG